jgi:subtilisin family serine protease
LRLKIAAIVILTSAVLFVLIERMAGPPVEPVPAVLPHIMRRPPPVARSWDSATTFINPTSEVRQLHARGITGRHVGVAIIDSFLLTEHREYRDRLRWYDEIDGRPNDPAGWHGTAAASIAVGKTVGVAPEADLYFVGLGVNWARQPLGNLFVAGLRAVHSGQHQAIAIRRILELNRRLEPNRKIRVISMSIGWGPPWLSQTAAAVEEARRAGIFVSALDSGIARYGPVRIASAAGPDRYITVGPAGSWSIAYWAGRYALACQQDPSMTPDRFRSTVLGSFAH